MVSHFNKPISTASTFSMGNINTHSFTLVSTILSVLVLSGVLVKEGISYFLATDQTPLSFPQIVYLTSCCIAFVCLILLIVGNVTYKVYLYYPAVYFLRSCVVGLFVWAVVELIRTSAYLRTSHSDLFDSEGKHRIKMFGEYAKVLMDRDFYFYLMLGYLFIIWLLNMAGKDLIYVRKQNKSDYYQPVHRVPNTEMQV